MEINITIRSWKGTDEEVAINELDDFLKTDKKWLIEKVKNNNSFQIDLDIVTLCITVKR